MATGASSSSPQSEVEVLKTQTRCSADDRRQVVHQRRHRHSKQLRFRLIRLKDTLPEWLSNVHFRANSSLSLFTVFPPAAVSHHRPSSIQSTLAQNCDGRTVRSETDARTSTLEFTSNLLRKSFRGCLVSGRTVRLSNFLPFHCRCRRRLESRGPSE